MALKDDTAGPDKRTGFTFRGQEIILSKTRGRPFSGLVAKGMERGIYPESKRIEAVTLYAALGHYGKVAELTGIPENRLREWRKTDWFQNLLIEIREENNEKIDAKFTEIVADALDQIGDRVRNGDFAVHPRTGEIFRKPVGVRDLSLVAAINIDKRQLLRGLPTSRTESVGNQNSNKLEKLAEAFQALANKTRPKIIEVQTVEVIEDANEPLSQERNAVGQVTEVRNETTVGDELGRAGNDPTVHESQGEELRTPLPAEG